MQYGKIIAAVLIIMGPGLAGCATQQGMTVIDTGPVANSPKYRNAMAVRSVTGGQLMNAMTVMATHETGVLRFVSDDKGKAHTALKNLGTRYSEADVVLLELRNQPGAMAHVCETLAGQHINVEYAYSGPGGRNGKSIGVFKVSNTEKAARILAASPNNNRRRMGRRPMHTRGTPSGY